jgi:hypothetical protein
MVRPTTEGSSRAPDSAKKRALMSSLFRAMLAHEGDGEALGGEPALEVREPRRRLLVDEPRRDRPLAQSGERLGGVTRQRRSSARLVSKTFISGTAGRRRSSAGPGAWCGSSSCTRGRPCRARRTRRADAGSRRAGLRRDEIAQRAAAGVDGALEREPNGLASRSQRGAEICPALRDGWMPARKSASDA